MSTLLNPFTGKFDFVKNANEQTEYDARYLLLDQTSPQTLLGSFRTNFLTSGRVLFAGANGILDDDSTFLWDNTNKRLGIGSGITTPRGIFDLLTTITTVDPATTIDATQTAGGILNYISTDYREYQVWPYKLAPDGTTKVFGTHTYGPSAYPASTPDPYYDAISWDAVTGVDGYIIVQTAAIGGQSEAGYWIDVAAPATTVNYGDGVAVWTAGPATVTPVSPYGVSLYVRDDNGQLISSGDITSVKSMTTPILYMPSTSGGTDVGSISFTQESEPWSSYNFSSPRGVIFRMSGADFSFEFINSAYRFLLVGTNGGDAVFSSESTVYGITFATGSDGWGTATPAMRVLPMDEGVRFRSCHTNDNDKTFFGTGNDASMYFDGSDLIVNSENVTASDEVHFTNFSLYQFDAVIRSATSLYRRYYHLPLTAVDPGLSGATWTPQTANNLNGWQLNAATEILYFQADVHADWDGATDLTVEIKWALLSAGSNNDTVDLKLVCRYAGVGDAVTKTQTLEVATTTTGTQYKIYKTTFTINWDETSNVVEVGDVISFALNLETDTSEIDNILIVDGSFSYLTTHNYIEAADV